MRLAALQQRLDDGADTGRRRRTALQVEIDRHDGVDGQHAIQQYRHDLPGVRNARVQIAVFQIDGPQHFEGDSQRVAQGGHVARHGTIAERDQIARAGADLVDHGEVFLVGDGSFDQSDVGLGGELLDIDERAVDDVHLAGQVDQPFVHVEKGHVTAGTAGQPDCREFHRSHCFFSRAVIRKASRLLSFSISATVAP